MPAVQPTKAITAAHRMTDDEVIEAAEAEGFESSGGRSAGRCGSGSSAATTYPTFGVERLAISYMADWPRHGRVFA